MENFTSPELGALALAKSLLPHIENATDMDEFLLFPPDLFALTSLILGTTGAYRLIVSPPRAISGRESKRELWMPTEDENMLDFSEFNENSIDDFTDIPKLVKELFDSHDNKISAFLRTKLDQKEVIYIKSLYDEIENKDYEKNRIAFIPLEKKISSVLNHIIKGNSLYKEIIDLDEYKDIFSNTNLPDEFWDILSQLDEISGLEKVENTKRLNRLFLEAFYPYAIKTSLIWNERVRKAGLDWRKNLARKFDKPEFIKLKERTTINNLEILIETLQNFEEIVKKRNELQNMSGEVNKQRCYKRNKAISDAVIATKLNEKQLLKVVTRTKIINEKITERGKKINERRQIIREKVKDEKYVPRILRKYWENFRDEVSSLRDGKIRHILCETDNEAERKDHWQRFISIVSLHAIADETCAGWGIRGPLKFLKEGLTGRKISETQRYAEELLTKYGSLATINKDRCRVLPKRHTAEVGITLRSISCNLGFHRSSVEVKWRMDHTYSTVGGSGKPRTALNVLLLPIPLEIHTTDFRRKTVPVKSHQNSQDFFEYNPDVFGVKIVHGKSPDFSEEDDSPRKKFEERIKKILNKAREEVGRVDMVVLPEIAINEYAVEFLENAFLDETKNPVTTYIAGVRESGERFNRNAVYFKVANQTAQGKWEFSKNREDYTQYKHHRWKLDRSQIIQYQLGGALSPTKSWWEAIKIGDREVNFINIGEQLTVCPLICEDLARQDPISDLIRTVGPTLLVAILMDGPQLLRRWAGKYASVLGDDPGSAVITLTSYGMVKRSLVQGQEPSRIIALWSSPESKTEIELEKGAEAVLLSLSVDERREKSADGREEMGGTPSLSLAGIRQIKLGDFEEASRILRC